MLKNQTSAGFLAALILLVAIPFIAKADNSDTQIIKSDAMGISFVYTPDILSIDTINTIDGVLTILPRINGGRLITDDAGRPQRIEVVKQIVVPDKDGFYLSGSSKQGKNSFNARITPVPTLENNNDIPQEIYKIDNSFSLDEFGKSSDIRVEYSGIMRNIHIASVVFDLISLENGSFSIPESYQVDIKYKNIGLPTGFTSKISYDGMLLNADQVDRFAISNSIEKSKDNYINKVLALSSGNWIKIAVSEEGVYKIDASQISGMGHTISSDLVATIKIFGNGGLPLSELPSNAENNNLNEQEIIVKTDGGGNLTSVIFYGHPGYGFRYAQREREGTNSTLGENGIVHWINPYSQYDKGIGGKNSDKNYYLLTWGGDEGKRALAADPPSGNADYAPDHYIHNIFFKEYYQNAFKLGSGRYWFGGPLNSGRTFRNELHDLYRSADIEYRMSLGHRAATSGQYTITESGNEIMSIYMTSVALSNYTDMGRNYNSIEVPASEIPSDNMSTINVSYKNSSSGTTALPLFDYYEIHYPRYFVPINNELGFYSDYLKTGVAEYSVTSFGSGDIYGYEMNELSQPRLLKNLATTANNFKFKSQIDSANPKRFFISSKQKTPILESANFADFRNKDYNYDAIVITHPDLETSAIEYKEYRESLGLKVLVARTDHIFNEFASGIESPTAIRDFISHAFHKSSDVLTHIVLWGDCHYDYKKVTTNAKNFVVPWETADRVKSYYQLHSFSSDDYFVLVVGDDLINDLSIGRVPVTSDEQGSMIVEKIKHYENNSAKDNWRTQVTFVADDSRTSDGHDTSTHTGQAEELSALTILDDLLKDKIYLPEYPVNTVAGGIRKPGVTQEMLSVINSSGTMLLNYTGHGNPRVWSHEEVFDQYLTVPQMINWDKLFFLTAATCDFGRVDLVDRSSGAEDLFLSKLGGAIGVLSATRVVLSGQNSYLNIQFYKELFKRNSATNEYCTLGEVLLKVKMDRYQTNDRKYFLLGDPLMKILIPEKIVKFHSINDEKCGVDGDTIKLKALDHVYVDGAVYHEGTDAIDESFNGTIIVTMLDSDVLVKITDTDSRKTIHNMLKQGGALNRSAYKVENGRFTADFIIPKDISFETSKGRLLGYAYDESNNYAKGIDTSFVIDGINVTSIPDDKGPTIEINFDSRTFESGDYVQRNPLLIVDLADENGINTTGLGVGHQISAWIDGSPETIDLTPKFETSLEDSRKGTVEKYLYDLKSGVHTIKIRAWDVYNNFSIAEASFRIAGDEEGIIIENIVSIPNPMLESTTIRFNHNITPPFDLRIDIYTLMGHNIMTINETVTAPFEVHIPWDGLDRNGNNVPTGTYPYKIYVRSIDGQQKVTSSAITVIK
jgi:peptidase C25-like protein